MIGFLPMRWIVTLFCLWFAFPLSQASELERLNTEAQEGIVPAQCLLGKAYLYGEGTPQNFSKAVHWFRKAASSGDQIAQLLLAKCFDNGHGVPRSEVHYIGILRKLSMEGDLTAQHLLGLRLSTHALQRSWETNSIPIRIEAYKWLSLASAVDQSVDKDRELIRSNMSPQSTALGQRQAESFKPVKPKPLLFTDDWKIIPDSPTPIDTKKRAK